MKLFVFMFVLLVVLVQASLFQAKVAESASNDDDLKHVLSKRINGLWGKRLNNLWGKRSESDSDEVYQQLLRDYYSQARRNQFGHPRYSNYYKLNPLAFERVIAQHETSNDDNDNTDENMS